MPESWFISDTHWGHENIMRFCPSRTVLGKTIEEHDEALIERWNATVRPKDTVYHCGDFAFAGRKEKMQWAKRLNGLIKIVRGNHDTQRSEKYTDLGMVLLPSAFPLPGLRDVVLSHVPLHPMALANRWRLNVHGHLHEGLVRTSALPSAPADLRYMNVSCEQIDFRPIHREEIMRRLRQVVAGPSTPGPTVPKSAGRADARKR